MWRWREQASWCSILPAPLKGGEATDALDLDASALRQRCATRGPSGVGWHHRHRRTAAALTATTATADRHRDAAAGLRHLAFTLSPNGRRRR